MIRHNWKPALRLACAMQSGKLYAPCVGAKEPCESCLKAAAPPSNRLSEEVRDRLAKQYGPAKADEMLRHYREVDRLGLQIHAERKAQKVATPPSEKE
jgi:hypothetical protein